MGRYMGAYGYGWMRTATVRVRMDRWVGADAGMGMVRIDEWVRVWYGHMGGCRCGVYIATIYRCIYTCMNDTNPPAYTSIYPYIHSL